VRLLKQIRQSEDQSQLTYREPPENRFRVLTSKEELADVLTSRELREQIIGSYNSYFNRNQYEQWFGKNREDSYNVEGFLRGLGASYYDGNPGVDQAIHIDLFPFATLRDFSEIRAMTVAALFADGWAQRLVSRLTAALFPKFVILFGRTNCRYFAEYIDASLKNADWRSFESGKYFVRRSEQFQIPVVGLSTNLGNPKGFNKTSLRSFGAHIRRHIEKGTVN
jgi:hypothetical protein